MELLQMKDNESFQKSGIRRCWFIRVIDEVFLEIKEQQELLKKKDLRTFDFSTMYTCLQHQLIKKNVRIAVEEAVEYAQYRASKDGKCLKQLHSLKNVEDIMEHVNFIVDNTYLYTEGGILVHQEIGLPIGTNSAPEIANLTLYVPERDFINKMILENKEDEARKHANNFRLQDDVLTWGSFLLLQKSTDWNIQKPHFQMDRWYI